MGIKGKIAPTLERARFGEIHACLVRDLSSCRR